MISEKAMNQEPRVVAPPASPEPLLPSFPSVEASSRFPLLPLRPPVESFSRTVTFPLSVLLCMKVFSAWQNFYATKAVSCSMLALRAVSRAVMSRRPFLVTR